MEFASAGFAKTVRDLMRALTPQDCFEPEEYRLAVELDALPVGYDLISFVFLRPDGEVVWHDFLDESVTRSRSRQVFIRAVVAASRRFSELAEFIPERPADALICAACDGAGVLETLEDVSARCFVCAGLGWTVD